MDFQEIIAGTVGKVNTFGTCVGRVKAGAMSFARFSTDDHRGVIRGYVGEGAFTDDPLNTFGGAGVVEIPELQKLLHYICENGFEHHVAANFSDVSPAVHEAAVRYLGWESHVSSRSRRLRRKQWQSSRELISERSAFAFRSSTASADGWAPPSPNIRCTASAKTPTTRRSPTKTTCARWRRLRAMPLRASGVSTASRLRPSRSTPPAPA